MTNREQKARAAFQAYIRAGNMGSLVWVALAPEVRELWGSVVDAVEATPRPKHYCNRVPYTGNCICGERWIENANACAGQYRVAREEEPTQEVPTQAPTSYQCSKQMPCGKCAVCYR